MNLEKRRVAVLVITLGLYLSFGHLNSWFSGLVEFLVLVDIVGKTCGHNGNRERR